MDSELKFGQTKQNIKDSGNLDNNLDKVLKHGIQLIRLTLEAGKTV